MQMINDATRPELLATDAKKKDVAKLQKWVNNLNNDLQELGYTYKFELSIDNSNIYLTSL